MIINPIWFYLSQLSNDLKYVSFIVICVSILVCFVGCGCANEMIYDNEKFNSILKKGLKVETVLIVVCTLLCVFLPSKETCYQMIVSSQITEDNLKTVEETIKSSVDYIFEKMDK